MRRPASGERSIGGRAAGDCEQLGRDPFVADAPEGSVLAEIKRWHDEIKGTAAAQRGLPGEEVAHESQGRAAQDETDLGGEPLRPAGAEGSLNDAGDRGCRLGEVRKFIEHDRRGPIAAKPEEGIDCLAPVVEVERRRCPHMRREFTAEAAQCHRFGVLGGFESEAPCLLSEGAEEVRLAQAPSAVHDSEHRPGSLVA